MSNEGAVDSYVESVFNETPMADGEAPEGALDSWDDIPSEGDNSDDVHINSEDSNEVASENAPEDQDKDDSNEESDIRQDIEGTEEESVEPEQESEGDSEVSEQLEIPESLQEKGLTVSEEGEVGKIVKIDGEEQFVSLDELGNDYSGQKAIQQRFNELDRENKEFKQEVDTVNEYMNTFLQTSKELGALEGVKYLSSLSGTPPHLIERQLMQELAPKIEELQQMSPDQIQAKYTQEENEYLKQSLESKQEQSAAEQAQGELQNEISHVRETHGIDDKEWDEAYQYIVENEQAIREELNGQPIDAAFVADMILDTRAFDTAVNAFSSAAVDVSEDDPLLHELTEISKRNPDFDNDDLVELIKTAKKSAVESKASEGIAKRKQKSKGSSSNPKQTNTNNTTPQEDAYLAEIFE